MMDCTAINAEIAADTTHQGELGSEKGGKVCGCIPVLCRDDTAADTESRALDARDQYLSALALQRCPIQQQTAAAH